MTKTVAILAYNKKIADEINFKLSKPLKDMKWSPEQAAFIEAMKGNDSILLEAVAGSGKTTTLLAAAQVISKNIKAGTVHSFGFAAIRGAVKTIKVNDRKVSNIAGPNCPPTLTPYIETVTKLVSFAKQRAIGIVGSIDNDAEWYSIGQHFDLFHNSEGDNGKIFPEAEVVAYAKFVLKLSNEIVNEIDYDDMVYLPVFHGFKFNTYDMVMVDEAQDTNPARRALVRTIVKKGGRVVAVGDRHQAIYGFCHPAGTRIKTPDGHAQIQDLKEGHSVIGSTTAGALTGFKGGYKIKKTHQFFHSGLMITLAFNDRKVELTPHHKVPVHIGSRDEYYTYLMRRNGIYRVGYCQAFTSSDFMLTHRLQTEKADTAWILGVHSSKEQAQLAESCLLERIKGTTFNQLEGDISDKFPTEESEAMKILAEHGRMAAFPLIAPNKNPRIALTGAFITEACNIIDGMRLAFYHPNQAEGGKHGQRQSFVWTRCTVSSRHFSGTVYGLTLQPKKAREGYDHEAWPLYFAGDDILVHNTGADNDSLDLIAKDFNCKYMPLSITYRCPKAVVKFASQWVDHIQAADTAPEGSVQTSSIGAMMKRNDLNGTAAILCRNTAPIVSLAFSLIRKKIACKVEGRDVGSGLKRLCNRWRIASTAELINNLDDYATIEKAKALAKKNEGRAQMIDDQVETLKIIIEGVNTEGKHEIRDVIVAIDSLFSDDVSAKGILTLSTIHKSKGREWNTVFWLNRTATCPSKYARQKWQLVQEVNLMYVAATRAQDTLIDLS